MLSVLALAFPSTGPSGLELRQYGMSITWLPMII